MTYWTETLLKNLLVVVVTATRKPSVQRLIIRAASGSKSSALDPSSSRIAHDLPRAKQHAFARRFHTSTACSSGQNYQYQHQNQHRHQQGQEAPVFTKGLALLTVNESKRLMRLIYARVHPDLFTNHTQAQVTNIKRKKNMKIRLLWVQPLFLTLITNDMSYLKMFSF